jgi:hypothetical protein
MARIIPRSSSQWFAVDILAESYRLESLSICTRCSKTLPAFSVEFLCARLSVCSFILLVVSILSKKKKKRKKKAFILVNTHEGTIISPIKWICRGIMDELSGIAKVSEAVSWFISRLP